MNIKSVKRKKVQKIEEVKGSFAAFSGGDRGQYHKKHWIFCKDAENFEKAKEGLTTRDEYKKRKAQKS